MAEPREYQIVLRVQSALLAIAVASGYHYSVAATAVKFDPNAKVEDLVGDLALRPFIVLEMLPDAWKVQGSRPNSVHIAMPLTVHWASETVDEADEARALMAFRGRADVERALVADQFLGGLAMGGISIVRTAFDQTQDGRTVWVRVETEIFLHRVYGQPDS